MTQDHLKNKQHSKQEQLQLKWDRSPLVMSKTQKCTVMSREALFSVYSAIFTRATPLNTPTSKVNNNI